MDDGDLIGFIRKMVCSEDLFRRGQVLIWTVMGKIGLMRLPIFGRRRVGHHVGGIQLFKCCIVFFIAISLAAVNDDGSAGTAPLPQVWSVGVVFPKRRGVVHAVRGAALLP